MTQKNKKRQPSSVVYQEIHTSSGGYKFSRIFTPKNSTNNKNYPTLFKKINKSNYKKYQKAINKSNYDN